MGTPDFAVGVLDKLIQNRYHIVSVVQHPINLQGGVKKSINPRLSCML